MGQDVVGAAERHPKLDLAVAVTDKVAYSGYYVGSSGDTAYLIVATQPNGREHNVVKSDEPVGRVRTVGRECTKGPIGIIVARRTSKMGRGGRCWVRQLIAVKGPTQTIIGPRNAAVTADRLMYAERFQLGSGGCGKRLNTRSTARHGKAFRPTSHHRLDVAASAL